MCVAAHAKNRVFIHAGCVAWRGRAIILPGHSFAGKSTLVAALLQAGATNYSDEYAVLDKAGHVYPYPRRLSLRDGDTVVRRRCTAEDLGSQTGVDPIPVGMILRTRYRQGARWSPKPMSVGEAAMVLWGNAAAATYVPRECLAAIHAAVECPVRLQGPRGEADETAREVLAACTWQSNA